MSATIRGMIKDKLITHTEVTKIGELFGSSGSKSRIHFIHKTEPHISEIFKGLDGNQIAERRELLQKAHDVGLLLFVPTPTAIYASGYYTIRPAFFPLVKKYVESKKNMGV